MSDAQTSGTATVQGGTRAATSVEELRELRDPRTMRAFAHPVRLDLLETLALEGPLTATEAAALIGQSATTCSFHLRQLAKYGFVEDAGPGGTRERPWRLTTIGYRIPEQTGEPEVDLATDSVLSVLTERIFDRARRSIDERRRYSARWREVTGLDEGVIFVTPDEMAEVKRSLEEVLFRFAARLESPAARPPDAVPIELLICSYLMRPEQEAAS